ncbi:NAD(P)/FAD-dependent oxidoreductase [Clostridium manihotivorum]|uniref:Uncharacterized protein n=1 Tax=Clostridium manihotivorum TaxID=2320868 RepID=A0A3R5V5S2_9CLOT|nr:FAD-dependent oxidoreductase [Clostridium manihotivorum]QAA30893.1 hypothetical protein C1I91_04005 [Clostridium manihotivorum]
MTIRINNIVLDIDDDLSLIKNKVAKKLKISKSEIPNLKIIKESIDARKRDIIKFNYCLELEHKNEALIVSRANDKDVKIDDSVFIEEVKPGSKPMTNRPVVIGMGPAGLFAALLLAKSGYRPLVFERGEAVDERTATVERFWSTGELNKESNVQFGEGGAGAFSDGKLTTRIKDRRCDFILSELIKAGAPEEIAYMGKPHVGTDILKTVVKNIREQIRAFGGEVHFSSKLERIIHKDGSVKSIIVNGNEIPCDNLIIAIGHSSRDTYEMMCREGIIMNQKPFAIGVRVEHPQSLIDINQYGKFAGHPRLRAAEYRLTHTSDRLDRSIYSFCMCPGGEVVAAASEENRLVVNGMSYHARDKENANSAVVVTVGPKDFEGTSPLAGMEFQRHYEELAYKVGGGNYIAPVQLVGDFLRDKKSTRLGKVSPSYTPGYNFRELKDCLPLYVTEALKEGLVNFDKKIKGFADDSAVMIGIETRTSAPVRIERNENLESISLKGMYPAGEGAGFAGGIVSAAVDGLKVAENIIKNFCPLNN